MVRAPPGANVHPECHPRYLLATLSVGPFIFAACWALNCAHRPHYIEHLRAEIQEVTDRLGWSKDAIGSMPKLDSFMKECMRMTPISPRKLNLDHLCIITVFQSRI